MTERPTAIVTGASSGIGQAIAGQLEEDGYRVFGTSRSDPAYRTLDVTDGQSCRDLVDSVLSETGRIDVLVNSAGYAALGSLEDMPDDRAQAIMDTNFGGAARMSRAVLPSMRERRSGRIIHISSIVGFVPVPFMGFYAASKHALEAYAETLDHEVRGFGVRSILIEPGFVRSRIGQNMEIVECRSLTYREAVSSFHRELDAAMRTAQEPETVAWTVRTAIKAARPKLRYQVGREARLLRALRRFAPERTFDRSLRRQFKIA